MPTIEEIEQKTKALSQNVYLPNAPPEEQLAAVEDSYKTFQECFTILGSETDSNLTEAYLQLMITCGKILRNSCEWGSHVQNYISSLTNFIEFMHTFLESREIVENKSLEAVKKLCWELFANLGVMNIENQTFIWNAMHEYILKEMEAPSPFTDVQLMIAYNMFKTYEINELDGRIFKLLVNLLKEQHRTGSNLEFLHIFFQHFVTNYGRILQLYGPLNCEDHILILEYVAEYIRFGSSEGPVSTSLLVYLSKEFKKKSECILNVARMQPVNNELHAREVFALIEVISFASGSELYDKVYVSDQSLFLNIGALLQSLSNLSVTSGNIFAPMQQLEEVATNSAQSTDFEREISFELKTLLVQALSNLSYRNTANQIYARELGFLGTILQCTRMDARNPLIKEWSIVAIRNLCEHNPENQKIIAGLTKIGQAPNDILTELNLDMGSLRIQPNE